MIKRGYELLKNGVYPPTPNGGCPLTFLVPDSNGDEHWVTC